MAEMRSAEPKTRSPKPAEKDALVSERADAFKQALKDRKKISGEHKKHDAPEDEKSQKEHADSKAECLLKALTQVLFKATSVSKVKDFSAEVHRLRCVKTGPHAALKKKNAKLKAGTKSLPKPGKEFAPRKNSPDQPHRMPVLAKAEGEEGFERRGTFGGAVKRNALPEALVDSKGSPPGQWINPSVSSDVKTTPSQAVQAAQKAASVASPRPAALAEVVQIRSRANGGTARVTLDLGAGESVELSLDIRDGVARVIVQANRPDLVLQLQKASEDLARALTEAGLQPDVQFGQEDESEESHRERHEMSKSDAFDDEDETGTERLWDWIPGNVYIVT